MFDDNIYHNVVFHVWYLISSILILRTIEIETTAQESRASKQRGEFIQHTSTI